MKNLLNFSLAASLVLVLATSAQAHNKHNGGNGPSCNPTLRCDAGGPYLVNGEPGVVSVQLDGLGSTGALDYVWNTTYPGAYFNDAALPNPVLIIPVTSDCSFNVTVELLVKNGNNSKSCTTRVKVRDRVKPVIMCPGPQKIISGMDESPQALGFATATDNCDQNVSISYCDKRVYPECRGDRFAYIIERTWRAVDNDCNVSKCVQIIDVVRFFAHLDILPGVCPNPYNANACGSLPIAITGAKDFNVTQIQWSSLRLYGLDCSAGPLAPNCIQLADVATPFINTLACNCTDLNGDGRLDLLMRFSRSQINQAFGLANAPAGTTLTVVVIGKLHNGVQFVAQDCMTLQ
ncbi:MAG: hypothetical protein JNL28_06265 [Planctomycetes bacterium]|nr:hypothetical protein [Planctomycetota bacterium]